MFRDVSKTAFRIGGRFAIGSLRGGCINVLALAGQSRDPLLFLRACSNMFKHLSAPIPRFMP